MISDVRLVSHVSKTWPKAREIYTATDGWLLTITHRVLFDTCARLLEEKLADANTMVEIVDSSGIAAPICGRLRDVLGIPTLLVA